MTPTTRRCKRPRRRVAIENRNPAWFDRSRVRETMCFQPGQADWSWPFPFRVILVSPLFNPDIYGVRTIQYPHPSEYTNP